MMKSESKSGWDIKYTVKSMDRYPFKKEYVAVFLTPCEKIKEDMENKAVKMINMGGGMIPMGGVQMFEMDVKQMLGQPENPDECRDIIVILSEIDYFELDWGYGDIIHGNFKKVRDGKEKVPSVAGETCQR